MKWLIFTGSLKLQGDSKAVANYERPKCAACEFRKGHRQSNTVNTIKNNPMKEKGTKKDNLLTGQKVSTDHYISWDLGRIYHTKGNSDPSEMFSEECDFIDHVSGYVRIKHQVSIKATETVKARPNFEREAQSQGVEIKGYQDDNGIFNTPEVMKELLKKHKNIRFSGAVTSHQNGAVHCDIKAVVTMESTMLMQTALRCPDDAFSTDLWPTPMDYYVWFYNRIPEMQSGLSSIKILSGSRFEPFSETISNCNVWGCTTYVLETKLQNHRAKIPKWATRIQLGVNMGFNKIYLTQVEFFKNK